MVAVAVSLFLAFSSSSYNLDKSTRRTYERLKMLDYYVSLRGVGSSAVAQVESIPGVVATSARRVVHARILMSSGADREANARIISEPVGTRPEVNDLFIHEGRYLQALRGEALLERRFAAYHGIHVGDRIQLKRRYAEALSFTVVGLVSSPEFIWLADDRLDPRPAARRLAVVYVSQSDASSVAGQGGYNEIQVRVSSDKVLASAMEETRRRLLSELTENPVPRSEQASNALLLRDRRAFAGVAVLFPLIFLSLATITLGATLWQLVAGQRKLIGVMMAQGISNQAIIGHYLYLCAVVAGIGGLAGIALGQPLGEITTRAYVNALGLPMVVTAFYPELALTGIACIMIAALLTGWGSTYRLLGLEPATVARVEFAPIGRVPRLEKIIPFLANTTYIIRLPLRNVMRNPLRNLGVVFSLAFSVAVLLMTLSFYDSEDNTLGFFFKLVHHYDLQVDLNQPTSPGSLPPFGLWPGVQRSEFFLRQSLILSTDGTRGHKEIERGVWGIPPESHLVQLYDKNREPIQIANEDQMLLGPLPMTTLGVGPGATVRLRSDSPQMRGREFAVTLGPNIFEPVANPPKLELSKLQDIMEQTTGYPRDGINIVLMKVDRTHLAEIRDRLYASPVVAEVTDFGRFKEDVQELLQLANAYFGMMAVFSGLLAFALLVASSAMTVADRSGEIATLAVLGMSERSLALMLIVETMLLWAGAIVLGVPGGYLLGNWLLNHYQAELIQMQLSLSFTTVLYTTVGSLVLCLIATIQSLGSVLKIPLSDATRSAS